MGEYLSIVFLPLLYYFLCFMNYGEIFKIIYTVRAVFFILYAFWVYVSVKVSDNF